jgi:quercetin dioxygenase-like cupin family protein
MHRTIALPIVPAVIVGFVTAAGALAPIGVTYEDHGRAQVAEAATLTAAPGRDLVIASYTLAPGTDSGWRDHGGPAVLAVTSGALVIRSAPGCATSEYTAGEAAVVPAGRHILSNAGDRPLAFSGAFLDGAADGITPFLDGGEAPAPTGCGGAAGNGLRTASARVSPVRSGRGTFVGPDAYQHSAHGHHAGGIEVEAGKDILVASYRGEPYATAGWMTHLPAFEIVTKGTVTYYEGHDGHCVKAGEFTAGQAYVHTAPVTHMPVNETPAVVEVTVVYFNLPHNAHPLPVAGNQTDAVDFAALPPADCPRLK